MKHFGDITKLSGYELPIVDVITGGSPCQDLSIAGNRAGLSGERSGLFMEQVRIVKEMREHDRESGRTGNEVRPRFMVWENVKGAFTSNKGKDFQAVLTEIFRIAVPEAPDVPLPDSGKWPHAGLLLDEVGGVSVAWRLHDAQFWGVPQRRERISVVADFGGLSAGQILFESEGLQGNSNESRETAEGTSTGTEGSADRAGKCLNTWDVQSKHIQPKDGIAEALYSGECRYGGGESYVFDDDHPVGINGNIATTLDAHCMNTPGNRGGGRTRRCSDSLSYAVDCRNGIENAYINGTLQAKSSGGTSVNLNNVVRIVDRSK